jgi:cytochrome c peroxidase
VRLFSDVRLSIDSTISCATCHMPGYAFAEPRQRSQGIGPEARRRNAPSLINVAVFRDDFDWDGRARTLEAQLDDVFSPSGDMGVHLRETVSRLSEPADEGAFTRAYGGGPSPERIKDALVAFQRTLLVSDSRFELAYLGGNMDSLTEAERRGFELFRSGKAGCAGCHVPMPDPDGSGALLFADGRFHNLGVGYAEGRMSDLGRYEVTRDPSDWGAFRTPSLRNVALTAPYMHDGSLETLSDVIAFYEAGGISNPNLDPIMVRRTLSQTERIDLITFLKSLTSEGLTDSAAVRARFLRGRSQGGQ